MRDRGRRTAWDPFDVEDEEWESIDDLDWPDSSLEVDDDEFARAIAEGREDEVDAA